MASVDYGFSRHLFVGAGTWPHPRPEARPDARLLSEVRDALLEGNFVRLDSDELVPAGSLARYAEALGLEDPRVQLLADALLINPYANRSSIVCVHCGFAPTENPEVSIRQQPCESCGESLANAVIRESTALAADFSIELVSESFVRTLPTLANGCADFFALVKQSVRAPIRELFSPW